MREKLLAYARLLRLSNGPTAVADVWMGYAVVSGELESTLVLLPLTAASLCFYHGGMVLNDTVDADRDEAEQRGRPIEQGLISPGVALMTSKGLLVGGMVLAVVVASLVRSFAPVLPAFFLFATVVAYNSRYKATMAGPLLMGLCRFLNVQLGASAALARTGPVVVAPEIVKTPVEAADAWLASVVIGLYVVGVTVFARDEANSPSRAQLGLGALIAASAIGLIAIKGWAPAEVKAIQWGLIWSVVAMFALRGMAAAILQPTPSKIGRGVGIAIQGLVVIDATLAGLYAGPMAGLAILALLPVTMILARWIPQT